MSEPARDLGAVAARGDSLGSRASRSALASVAAQGASQGLRLAGNLILSHLLFPEAFGLMAIVNMVLLGLQAVSDFGLQPAMIRHARDDRAFLDTAWTLQVMRGGMLFVLGCALAWPLAAFYGEPELVSLVPAAGVSALMMGLASTKVATLTRAMRPAPILAIEVGSQAIGLVAMVAFALAHPSPWALAVGGVMTATSKTVFSHVALAGPRDRLRLEPQARHDLLTFGRWLLVSSAFTFVSMRADVALLGRLLSIDQLGVYSVGIMISLVVRDVLSQVNRFVLMPALSASQRAGSDVFVANFARVRRVALPTALLAILAATLLSPPFFRVLYDDRYHGAAWIAQLSMLGVWFHYLTDISFNGLVAVGKSRAWAFISAVRAVAIAGGCLAGFFAGGVPGLMLGGAAGAALTYVVSAIPLRRSGVHMLRGDALHTAVGLALGAAVALAPQIGAGEDTRELLWRTAAVALVLLAPYALWVARRLRSARPASSRP